MNKLRLCFIVSIALIVVIGMSFYFLAYHPLPVDTNSHKGLGIGYPKSTSVDEPLKPYLTVTTNGESGHTNSTYSREFLNGTVNWIASPQDSVKFLNNIHLVMYTHIDDRTYVNGTLTHLYVGSHIIAYQNELVLPNDTIDHNEVIIPKLGLDTPTYQFSLNCSTFIQGLN